MTEPYYRSPIDKLVVESGMTATLIAQYMQIKYHRMVALRRLKDVEEKDIELCKQAIAKIIDDKVSYRRGNIPVDIKSKVKESDIKLLELVKPTPEALAFMLGQLICLNTRLVDALDAHQIGTPCLLERKKQLEEQCNKLLGI